MLFSKISIGATTIIIQTIKQNSIVPLFQVVLFPLSNNQTMKITTIHLQ